MRIPCEPPLDQYWDVFANSSQDILVLMLRMFLPTCGVLSKARAIQWDVVKNKILPLLSKAAMDAKQQEYARRLATIKRELAVIAISSSNVEDTAVDGVNAAVNEATDVYV